ncbi:MAG: hypothetical protein H6566_27165 [Lewinellaceae bacterium]|nr:hypothetical protein [Lewinellaceae bacterium]
MISVFVNKETDDATMAFYEILKNLELPEHIGISINNTKEAQSGILRKEGKVVDISLANCYSLEDVVRELVRLVAEGK